MAEQFTLVRATMKHLKMETESLTDFRHQYAKLTEKDRSDLREQFTKEFGYEMVDSTTT